MRYIFAPTCCYQNVYPTTPTVRLTFVLKRIIELVFCNLLIVHIAYQHCLPVAIDAMPHFENRDYMRILLSTLEVAVPAAYIWLLIFYTLFHSYMNLMAELT